MKMTLITLTVALAAILLTTSTADARRWVYVGPTPVRVYVAPRAVALRPISHVLVPTTTVFTPTLTPNVVVGRRGRLHYFAPIQPIGVGTYVW